MEKREFKLKQAIILFEYMEKFKVSKKQLRKLSVLLRNPIIFCNQTKYIKNVLPYKIENISGKTTLDHLIGISNIVLYIFKNGIYKRWKTVDDMENTLRALNVTLWIPKKLNNKKYFKNFQFDINNIEKCIYWHKKLINEELKEDKIEYLIDSGGNKISVIDAWSKWYEENKEYI